MIKSLPFEFNKTDADLFSLCDQNSETISHFFIIVIRLKNYCQQQIRTDINFDLTIKQLYLFKKKKENKLLIHSILQARYFIYI